MSAQDAWHLILWVHFISAALWAGGIFFAAVIAAPAVNRSMASRALAKQILSQIFRRLHYVEFMCCFLLLATTISSPRFIPGNSEVIWKLIACITAMGIVTLYYTFSITPRLEASSGVPEKPEFDSLYKRYVGCLALNQALALVLIYQSVVIF